jgi:hypothetical protein
MIDQNTDITFHVLNSIVQESPDLAAHIKTAQVGEEVRATLTKHAFADPDNRLFPIHTKADAVLSKAYTTKLANVAPHVVQAIDNALDMYNVDRSIFAKTAIKVASTREYTYLLPETRQLPIRNKSDIKVAEDRLLAIKSKLSAKSLVKAATILTKQASIYGLNVKPEIMQMAGITKCDTGKTAEWIDARSYATSNTKIASMYKWLATEVTKLGSSSSREDLVKIAQALDTLDSKADIKKHYGKSIPDPVTTVFSTKIAMEHVLDLGGKEVPLRKLLEVDPNVYGDILGHDVKDEICDASGNIDETKMGEVFATLPKDMKDLLVQKLGL